MIRILVLCSVCALVACASDTGNRRDYRALEETRLEEKPQESKPAYETVEQKFDAKSYAATFPRALECEQAARRIRAKSADGGWAVLRACVEKGNFTLLRQLADGTWDEDLQQRPDAPLLVAKVVSQRGGDVSGDLDTLTKRRVPVFTLEAAFIQPETYSGQMVLIRARVEGMKSLAGNPTVVLSETSLSNEVSDVEVGSAYVSTRTSAGSARGTVESSRYGNASLAASGSSKSQYRSVTTEKRHDNSTADTGRKALGRLAKPDPFLQPTKEFIVLARFDGLRSASTGAKGEPERTAVLSIVTYIEPAALILE